MAFQLFTKEEFEKKLLSWATTGLLIFVSAFLWAPSRDGLQGVYLLSFFLPTLLVLLSRKPNFHEYGGWPTVIALVYSGFSTFSTLWNQPKDFGFFLLQWFVLMSWLCGSCLVFSKREIRIDKHLPWLVILGVFITLITIFYYYHFIFGISTSDKRLWGWNVFRNTNEIGAMCGITALLAFILAVQSTSQQRMWFFYILTFIAGAGLVASFSRGALLGFVIMAIIALIMIRPPLKIWLPPISIVAITLFILLITTHIFNYYTDGRSGDFGGRFTIWKEVFNRCKENIFWGIGMSKDTRITIPDVNVFNHAHNAWLDTLYRTGLIGLALILFQSYLIIKKASRDPRLLSLYMWFGYGLICNLFDGRCFFWEISAKWFLFWIPVGLIVAIQTSISLSENTTKLTAN